MATKLLVCDIAHQEFDPVGPTFKAAIVVLVLMVAGVNLAIFDQSHEDMVLMAVAAVYSVCYAHQLLSVTQEFTSILDIEVFRLKPKSK